MLKASTMNCPQFKENPEKALGFYWENGFLIEQNVIDHKVCDDVIEHALKLANSPFAPLMMPHRSDNVFLDFMKTPKILDILSNIFEGPVSGLQSEFFFCKPGTIGFSAHQDNFYVEADPLCFASAWTALTDVTQENGGLGVWPKTHKLGRLPVYKCEKHTDSGQDPNARDQEAIVPEGYEVIYPSIPKGSVLFIHPNVVHVSGTNTSSRFRYALLNTYVKKGSKFRAGNFAKREEIIF